MGISESQKENIDKEHICCAMSGKQSFARRNGLSSDLRRGLFFYRSAERGKCFIEYIPAENAWVPIEAAGWLYINCLWVSGSLKGHGFQRAAGRMPSGCQGAEQKQRLYSVCRGGANENSLLTQSF